MQSSDDKKLDNVVSIDFARHKKNAALKSVLSADNLAKLEKFSELIAFGKVLVSFNPRLESVSVPPNFKEDPILHLNFSRRYGIKDFIYDEIGIRATLSFPRGHFTCDVPWESVCALHSEIQDESFIWAPESFFEDAVVVDKPKEPRLRLVSDEDTSSI